MKDQTVILKECVEKSNEDLTKTIMYLEDQAKKKNETLKLLYSIYNIELIKQANLLDDKMKPKDKKEYELQRDKCSIFLKAFQLLEDDPVLKQIQKEEKK